MSLMFAEDSDFEEQALQRAVDADRELDAPVGTPPRLAVRVVLLVVALAVVCAAFLSALAWWTRAPL
ncbi:MAG: hypothetical protein BWZ09_02434 [Alphaproteobacteria bacterium ADurb.BinA305]|nr:MAG: hypothetical protein BWZ09_02434 [Alphaproteobacteria bacterium ADurb.BinA305]